MLDNTGKRSGRRVALVANHAEPDAAFAPRISNHGLRMIEASLRASGLEGLQVKVWDLPKVDKNRLLKEIIDFDPDVVGFSSYLWNFPLFVQLSRHLKKDDPARLIVFGGPSARPSMFQLKPWQSAQGWVDILVINEGEQTFVDIVESRDRNFDAMKLVPGIAISSISGWYETAERPLCDMNELPSAYQAGLVPPGGLAVLQTYRGCPFTCSFCEWGVLDSPKRVCSTDYLVKEFEAMARNKVDGALIVDAGLNLNPIAFRHIRDANRETGFFNNRHLVCEVYPAKVKGEHIEFLSEIGGAHVGIGLQSFDNEVLSHVERAYDEERFEATFRELSSVAGVAIEIILGLPGDTPENFRATFNRARSFGCTLRVYHCVVLPSALMVRAPESYELDFNPYNLKMRSCLGWTKESLQDEVEFVNSQAKAQDGAIGKYMWIFPPLERA